MSGTNSDSNSAAPPITTTGRFLTSSSGNNDYRKPPPQQPHHGRGAWNGDYHYDSGSDFLGLSLPAWTGLALKRCLGVTVALYILNQKHLLPKPLSAVVSKALFWPTLPITVGRRLGEWSTVVDDTVVIGGAPFGFVKYPEMLYHDYGVRGVVNLCQEYQGPDRSYRRLGMKHLRLPTVDHFEPSVADMEAAILFIKQHQERGEKVYVHCRAGHGRSAAIVFAWLLHKDPDVDLEQLNWEFGQLRNVRKTLWRQPNMKLFHARLLNRGGLHKRGGNIEMTENEGLSSDYDEDEDFDEIVENMERFQASLHQRFNKAEMSEPEAPSSDYDHDEF